MKVLTLHFRSTKTFEEIMELANSRENQYNKIKGLLQIVYLKDERIDQYESILFFDNEENLNAYRMSDLYKSIEKVYDTSKPEIRIFDVVKELKMEC